MKINTLAINAKAFPHVNGYKKVLSFETLIFLVIFNGVFFFLGKNMGAINLINTMMKTAYDLLMNTVFYILALAVVAGAISSLFTEFGVVSLINKILSPLMKPIYHEPGAAIIGIFATYLSDNPAILTLADDKVFRRYFKKYQLPALTNIGTSFGMGLIVTVYMMGISSPSGESFVKAALIGNLGAIMGSIVSTRIMLHFTKKEYGTEEWAVNNHEESIDLNKYRKVREGSAGKRFLEAMLEGGKSGVKMGVAIIPGVLIICTFVMILTNSVPSGGFTGAAYEGVGLLPALGDKISFILNPLFGFSTSSCIAVPITALGAAGAAIALVPNMISSSLASANDVAVFTAMCMCWSGFLSTHVAMMDTLGFSKMTSKAILSHTIGGLVAGITAHLIFILI